MLFRVDANGFLQYLICHSFIIGISRSPFHGSFEMTKQTSSSLEYVISSAARNPCCDAEIITMLFRVDTNGFLQYLIC